RRLDAGGRHGLLGEHRRDGRLVGLGFVGERVVGLGLLGERVLGVGLMGECVLGVGVRGRRVHSRYGRGRQAGTRVGAVARDLNGWVTASIESREPVTVGEGESILPAGAKAYFAFVAAAAIIASAPLIGRLNLHTHGWAAF